MSSDEPPAGLSDNECLRVTHAMLWIALRRLGYSDADILKLEQQAIALTDQTQAVIRDRAQADKNGA